MAIAGGATGAYVCYLDRDNNLITKATTTMRDLCFGVQDAAVEICNRKIVIVAGSDVVELRRLVAQFATKEQST